MCEIGYFNLQVENALIFSRVIESAHMRNDDDDDYKVV